MPGIEKKNIEEILTNYIFNNKKTEIEFFESENLKIPKYINEFWTSGQRKSSSIHEISYRACFKAQLPKFFIELLTEQGDLVYDPFSGRGTTVIEAGLLRRNIISNDINPLSEILSYPRFFIPSIKKIEDRLNKIKLDKKSKADIDLSMFYDSLTEAEIVSIRNYLREKKEKGKEDDTDKWIRMIATNRLTGHSKGFFSVYTLPPNQAVLQNRQIKINKKLKQKPEYKDTKTIIIKKSRNLIKNLNENDIKNLKKAGKKGVFLTGDAGNTSSIPSETVSLTVTSPPFLNVVQYSTDNWLRCWFNSLDDREISKKITMTRKLNEWSEIMLGVFKELYRITGKNGWVAFEVGEVRKGKIKLDEYVVPIGLKAGFTCRSILINSQNFTKTSNIWGIKNNDYGTNSNRIIIYQKC